MFVQKIFRGTAEFDLLFPVPPDDPVGEFCPVFDDLMGIFIHLPLDMRRGNEFAVTQSYIATDHHNG